MHNNCWRCTSTANTLRSSNVAVISKYFHIIYDETSDHKHTIYSISWRTHFQELVSFDAQNFISARRWNAIHYHSAKAVVTILQRRHRQEDCCLLPLFTVISSTRILLFMQIFAYLIVNVSLPPSLSLCHSFISGCNIFCLFFFFSSFHLCNAQIHKCKRSNFSIQFTEILHSVLQLIMITLSSVI